MGMTWVVTPSLPERAELLGEAIASVAAQDRQAEAHLIRVDLQRRGPTAVRNDLIRGVPAGDWIAFLDDDDVWYPTHLWALHKRQNATGADVVYSLADILGRPDWDPQREAFDEAALVAGPNYIPLSGIVRAGLLQSVGGFPDDGYEDYGMWLRLVAAGAHFECVPSRTWAYRFGPWDSRSKEVWRGERIVE